MKYNPPTDRAEAGIFGGSSGGSSNEWSIRIKDDMSFEDFIDENGDVTVEIFEMGVTYAGDWTLSFTENSAE